MNERRLRLLLWGQIHATHFGAPYLVFSTNSKINHVKPHSVPKCKQEEEPNIGCRRCSGVAYTECTFCVVQTSPFLKHRCVCENGVSKPGV